MKSILEKIGPIQGSEIIASWDSWDSSSQQFTNLHVSRDVRVGDTFTIYQHFETSIPGYCVAAKINEFIQDNLKGHQVSEQLANQFGLTGVGLKQMDYDVKCRGTLDKDFDVYITYKVEALPKSLHIGLIQLIIALIIAAILAAIIGHYALALAKIGYAMITHAGKTIKFAILLVAFAIASVSVVKLISVFKRR